jgi:hypothetical protein
MYEDGSPLPLGDSLFVVVTSDAAGTDTLHKGFISPDLHRQTLIIMGRGKKLLQSDTSSTKHLLLNDEDAIQDPDSVKIRIVHSISDLPALDIYFNDSAVGTPNTTISYGAASIRRTFFDFPGITVTEAGNKQNVITSISLPEAFNAADFIITAVLRGFSKPCDSEPVAAPLLISDNYVGGQILAFAIFGVRFVNATKSTTLSLSATNPPPQTPDPRMNIPGQEKVKNIPPDSVSKFFGVGITTLGNTRWFFCRGDNRFDTLFGTQLTAKVNERWTFIAFQNPDTSFNGLKLKDTMACVPEAFGKVRVVNLSPEAGPVTVQITGATPLSLSQSELGFATLSAGTKQVTISAGSLTQTHSIALPRARPISIYILPSKPGQAFPLTTSED